MVIPHSLGKPFKVFMPETSRKPENVLAWRLKVMFHVFAAYMLFEIQKSVNPSKQYLYLSINKFIDHSFFSIIENILCIVAYISIEYRNCPQGPGFRLLST